MRLSTWGIREEGPPSNYCCTTMKSLKYLIQSSLLQQVLVLLLGWLVFLSNAKTRHLPHEESIQNVKLCFIDVKTFNSHRYLLLPVNGTSMRIIGVMSISTENLDGLGNNKLKSIF